MSKSPSFLRQNLHLLAFGFLFTFISGFGQTFLVSLYVPDIQGFFGMSDGVFSSIYAAATLTSAVSLSYLGRFIDRVRLTKFAVYVLIGLIVANLLLSQAFHLVVLFLGIYMLRLFGQALSTHTSLTSMGRFFVKNRGKALGIAALGHPAGEAILPIIIVSLISWIGWRYSLMVQAGFVVCMIPILFLLLMSDRRFSKLKMYIPTPQTAAEKLESKPIQLLKSKIFWILAPSNFASASVGTAVLFFQLKIGAERGWSPTIMAASFVAYAVGNGVCTLFAGFLTDRFNARVLYPLYLIPFTLGLTLFYFVEGIWVYTILVASLGITNGYGGVMKNAALAELFGTKILGSVRSFFTTAMVFSTAVGPVLFGVLLDMGIGFQTLAIGSVLFMILITFNSLRVLKLQPKMVE